MNLMILLPVLTQAILSFVFLVQFTVYVRWWKTLSGWMTAGLTACLFTITLTLTVTGTNEGLGSSPVAVTVGRLGFSAVLALGITVLQFRRHALREKGRTEKDDIR